MNREQKRQIQFGKDKPAVRAIIRGAKDRAPSAFRIGLAEWLRVQPGSTRRGVNRGNFQLPNYVVV